MQRPNINNKEVRFSSVARDKLKQGMNIVADAVGATLGPRGRNAMIQTSQGPLVTKDGITVAKHIKLKDQTEDMGALLIQQVSKRANDEAGDGTTTATVLAQALINEGMRELDYGADAQAIRRGLEHSADLVLSGLANLSQPVEDIEAVASISANDPEIGKVIAQMVSELGPDGTITLEEGQTTEMETEVVQGMHWRGGWMSPYLVTDGSTMRAEYEDIRVLLTDENPTLNQLVRIITKLLEAGEKKLVVISNHIEDEALRTLALNKAKGSFFCLPVRAPKYGTVRKAMLEDMAVLTQGTYVGSEGAVSLDKVEIEHLGTISRIVAEEKYTTITATGDTAQRLAELKTLLASTNNKHDQQLLEERISKLAGGIGVIRVGATTEADAKEKLHRVEDAVNATKAAQKEGIVAGGGVALYDLRSTLTEPFSDVEEDVGRRIMLKALEAPVARILTNAGAEVKSIMKAIGGRRGFNAKTLQLEEDMIAAGIIDPAKVTRLALEAAVSIAIMVLTTEVSITDEPAEHEDK